MAYPKLTKRQEVFVREYLVDLNATRAAISAGYSKKTASAIGTENLKKPKLKALVDAAMAERAARVEVRQDVVLRGVMNTFMYGSQQVAVLDAEGAPVPARDVNGNPTDLVRQVDPNATLKSAEMLGRHLGDVFGKDDGGVQLNVGVQLNISPTEKARAIAAALVRGADGQ